MLMYGNENKGNYPRVVFKPGEAPTQYTGVEAKDPFAKEGGPAANDVTAAIFLLLRTQDVTPAVFVCPSTDTAPLKFAGVKSAQDFSNFKSDENLSYSIANPYSSKEVIGKGYKWNVTLGAEFAIAADMNPGTVAGADVTPVKGPKDERAAMADMRKANSFNHGQDGQNVLFGDGHVEFQQNPFCGIRRDNIYTVSGSDDGSKTTSDTIAGTPAWAGDSVLLPAAAAVPKMKSPEEQDRAEIERVKEMLPSIKARIAEQQKWVEAMEKRIADEEAKQQPKK
jgi:prepilin-type processing-associated H-X9-DG protein